MGLIFRYLAKETYTTMLAVTSILVLIFMSHQFVHYLGDAALGRLTPKAVFQMMCIQIPLLVGFMLPLGLFIGILLTYGRLYVDNEMTIFTACGVSKLQVLAMSLILSVVVTFLVAIIMFWVEPAMAKYRNEIIAKAAISSPIEKVSPGRFQHVGNWILYSEAISRDRQVMANVFAAEIPKVDQEGISYRPLDVITASKAFQKSLPSKEKFIVLSNGYRYEGTPGKNKYQIAKFGEYGVRLPNKTPDLGKQEEFMSFLKLWKERKHNPIALAEIQWRIAMPISVILLTLVAVPLSEVKPRKGRFAQILPAIVIYIAYTDLLFLGRAWLEKAKISPTLGLWWIHGIVFFLGMVVLYYKLPIRFRKYV
jgi:lipopolysaccharide export system permease protein